MVASSFNGKGKTMKEAPKVIYLQIGEDCQGDDIDWSEATWCTDKVFDNDIEYRKPQQMQQDIRDYRNDIEQLKSEIGRLRNALEWLVKLKRSKDENGKTREYIEDKPHAWLSAINVLKGE